MKNTWLSPRALGLHAALVVAVPGFLFMGWWQLHRALAGNGLSWAYTVEWPFFCAYAIVMWWRLVHDIAADRAARPPIAAAPEVSAAPAPGAPAADAKGSDVPGKPLRELADPHDEELAVYNRYLAELNDKGKPKRW